MGHIEPGDAGLYHQLTWAANELGNGYYGWRSATLTEVRMTDGIKLRLAPELNAGTVALQWYFSLHDAAQVWAFRGTRSAIAVIAGKLLGAEI